MRNRHWRHEKALLRMPRLHALAEVAGIFGTGELAGLPIERRYLYPSRRG